MHEAEALKKFIESRMSAAWELLRQMVGINSWTLNPGGVNRLAQFTAESFAPLGFTAEFVAAANPAFGKHLVLTRRGKSSRSVAMISPTEVGLQLERPRDMPEKGSGERIGLSLALGISVDKA